MLATESLTKIRKMNMQELIQFSKENSEGWPLTVEAALVQRAMRLLNLATPEEICEISAVLCNRMVLRAISERILGIYSAEIFVARSGFPKIAELLHAFAIAVKTADVRVRGVIAVTKGTVRESLEDLVKFYRACLILGVKTDESIRRSIVGVLVSKISEEENSKVKKKQSNVIFNLDDVEVGKKDFPSGKILAESLQCLASSKFYGDERTEVLRGILKLKNRINMDLGETSLLVIAVAEIATPNLLYSYRLLLRNCIESATPCEMTPRSAKVALIAANAVGLHDRTTQRRLFNVLGKYPETKETAEAFAYCERFGSWKSSRVKSTIIVGELKPVGIVGRIVEGKLRMMTMRRYKNFIPVHFLARFLLTVEVRNSRKTFHSILLSLRHFEGEWVTRVANFMVLEKLIKRGCELPSSVDEYRSTKELIELCEQPPMKVPRELALTTKCAVSKLHSRCEVCQKARMILYAAMCERNVWCF